MLELYHYGDSLCSMKVRLCLIEKGVDYESRFVDLMKFENLKEDYKKLNPNGVVPTIVHDGTPIIESSVINQYIDEVFDGPLLTPEDPAARARMRIWTKLQDDVIHPAVQKPTFNLLIKPKLAVKSDEELDNWLDSHPLEKSRKLFKGAARGPVDEAALEDAKGQFKFVFDRMEAALEDNDWLCGDEYSLADVAYAPMLDRLAQCEFTEVFDDYPNLQAWSERVRGRAAFEEMRPKGADRFSNMEIG